MGVLEGSGQGAVPVSCGRRRSPSRSAPARLRPRAAPWGSGRRALALCGRDFGGNGRAEARQQLACVEGARLRLAVQPCHECSDGVAFVGRDRAQVFRLEQGRVACLGVLARLGALGADCIQLEPGAMPTSVSITSVMRLVVLPLPCGASSPEPAQPCRRIVRSSAGYRDAADQSSEPAW